MKRILPLAVLAVLLSAAPVLSLEKGAMLYHSGRGDILYGRNGVLTLPCSPLDAFYGELKSGHAGIYIGDQKIIHAVRDGVVEVASENFITQEDLDEGCKYLGAKVPVDFDNAAAWPQERKDQIVVIAREQVGKAYDFTFHLQKGNGSGDFTCVGLVEYVYEEVGYNVTPDGYYSTGAGGETKSQTYNCIVTAFTDWTGINSFAQTVEFSRIQHPLDALVGREYEGGKYIFFPYTQYLQATTVAVPDDSDTPVSGGEGSGGLCFLSTVAPGGPAARNAGKTPWLLGGAFLLIAAGSARFRLR
jgi:uncharacterized protein YycO